MLESIRRLLAWSVDPVKWAAECCGWEADAWQAEALYSRRHLILLCSRQSGKSTTTAALCAHRALARTDQTIVIVSPGQRQSSETFLKAVKFVRPSLDAFGLRLTEDNRLSLALDNGSRIISLPASEETIRSYSADLLVLDEASRIPDAVWTAVRPMTAATGGRTVLLSTPFGLEGFFSQVWHAADGLGVGLDGWHRIKVTADQIARIMPAFLEQERQLLGEVMFQQEYFCDFQSNAAAAFSWADISEALAPTKETDFLEEDEDDDDRPVAVGNAFHF